MLKPKRINLSGVEILDRVLRGHLVRRAAWVDEYYIRITNDRGIDENGYVTSSVSLYTISTAGVFLHLGYSHQPLRNPSVFYTGMGYWDVAYRSSDGLNMFLEHDWEDYGYISRNDFAALEYIVHNAVSDNLRLAKENAIKAAERIDDGQQGTFTSDQAEL